MVTVALQVVLLSGIAEHSCEHGRSHPGWSEKAMMRMRAMGRQVGVVAVAMGAPALAGDADVVKVVVMENICPYLRLPFLQQRLLQHLHLCHLLIFLCLWLQRKGPDPHRW